MMSIHWILSTSYEHSNVMLLICTYIFVICASCTGHHEVNVTFSKAQTWQEVTRDNNCRLVGLDQTGVVGENGNCMSIKERGAPSMAWIGAHAERVWVHYEGCVYGSVGTSTWIKPSEDLIKVCLLHCDTRGFVLTQSTCFCADDITLTDRGCIAKACRKGDAFCGHGFQTIHTNPPRIFHCMCRYGNSRQHWTLHGTDRCLTVVTSPNSQMYRTSNCSSSHKYICYDGSNGQMSVSEDRLPWLEAGLACYSHNQQFSINQLHTLLSLHPGTYWVADFVVTLIKWGITSGSHAGDNCVAVNITEDLRAIPTLVSCNMSIPGCCDTHVAMTQTYTSASTSPRVHDTLAAQREVTMTTKMNDGDHESSKEYGIVYNHTTIPSTSRLIPSSASPRKATYSFITTTLRMFTSPNVTLVAKTITSPPGTSTTSRTTSSVAQNERTVKATQVTFTSRGTTSSNANLTARMTQSTPDTITSESSMPLSSLQIERTDDSYSAGFTAKRTTSQTATQSDTVTYRSETNSHTTTSLSVTSSSATSERPDARVPPLTITVNITSRTNGTHSLMPKTDRYIILIVTVSSVTALVVIVSVCVVINWRRCTQHPSLTCRSKDGQERTTHEHVYTQHNECYNEDLE